MTWIYGLWRFDGGSVAADFQRMDRVLSRFGSDDHEVCSDSHRLAMGRRLRRSVPEDCFRAPVRAGSRYLVVGDVRLTEREDLAGQLELGLQAARMSDSAIAAAAIEAWDEEAFDRIYGAFAIVAWDTREQRLLLARDHLGHKPLFFHQTSEFFAFASMPDGLHAIPSVPRGPDIESMKRFLALEHQSPGRTHFEGIERVMPGHYVIVDPDGLANTRYWAPDLTPLNFRTHQDYVNALSENLDRAVAAALRGVGAEVGAQLSSGFDSSAVATAAARQLYDRGAKVVAYTAAPREGFESANSHRVADESLLASATAAMHPNILHVVMRSDRTPMENLARTASIYGLPALNICNETWFAAINDDANRRGITVMLEATMGNATISETGILALSELVRRGRVISWFGLAVRLMHKRELSLAEIIWYSFRHWIPNEVYRWLIDIRFGPFVSRWRYSALRRQYLRDAVLGALKDSPVASSESLLLSNGHLRPSGNSLDYRLSLLGADDSGPSCKGALGEWRIDYRDPTADRRLVEFSLRVPSEQLIHDGDQRALLRKVLASRVPIDVLNNRLHGYQAADWYEWLDSARAEVADQIRKIETFEPTAEIIDVERLKALLDDWPEDDERWGSDTAVTDYRFCLLRAISAASFMREAARSNH